MKGLLLLLFFLAVNLLVAQDHIRFEEEVRAIGTRYDSLWDPSRETVVFTGSSSIRFWRDLPERFPEKQLVNSGFGGSQASDLLAYSGELILRYRPNLVVIYEGDNDIHDAKKPGDILKVMENIIARIRAQDPDTWIVLIGAKPSPVRWHLKRAYKKLNRKFSRLCKKDPALEYADVWKGMLDGRKVRTDLFLEDGLHMNEKGYDIWYHLIKAYIN